MNNHVISSFDWLGALEIAGTKYIGEVVSFNQTEYLTDWVAVGSPTTTPGGQLVQEYQRSVKIYDLVEEYEVTPYYDSTWVMLDQLGDLIATAIGSTLGGVVGQIVGGPAGMVVGVTSAGIITYYICTWTGPNPTREVWGASPINTFQRNISYDYAIKYEVVE